MRFERFEDIVVWQKAKNLAIAIYGSFQDSRDFGFRDQILKASVSVMNNVAEGFERKTNNDFKHFLFIAKGSCGEVRSMVLLAKDLGTIDNKSFETLYNATIEISKMLSGLIKKL